MDVLNLNRAGEAFFASQTHTALKGQEQGDVHGHGIGSAYDPLGHMFRHGNAAARNNGDAISDASVNEVVVHLSYCVFDKPGLVSNLHVSVPVSINVHDISPGFCQSLNALRAALVQGSLDHHHDLRVLCLEFFERSLRIARIFDFNDLCCFNEMTMGLDLFFRKQRDNIGDVLFQVFVPGLHRDFNQCA